MIESNFKVVDSNSSKSVLASLLYLLIVGVSIVVIKSVYIIAFTSILGYTSPITDLIIFCFIVIFLIRKTVNVAADTIKVENLKLYRKLVMIIGLVLVFIYYISSYLGHNIAASILETSLDYNGPIDWFVKYLKAPIDTSGISDFESVSLLFKLMFIAITTYAFTRDRGSIKHSAITVENQQFDFLNVILDHKR